MLPRLVFYPTLLYNVTIEKLGFIKWYNRIDETVILGALPFTSTANQLVKEENIKGVITMNEEYETRVFCPDQKGWESLGVNQLRLDTQDLVAAPSSDKMAQGVDFLLDHRNSGNSVYVHCKAGRTRSATIVAAYLMKLHGVEPERAVEMIREKRPHISIRKAQREALTQFYSTLRKTKQPSVVK